MKIFVTVIAAFLASILTVEVTADVATAHKRLRSYPANLATPSYRAGGRNSSSSSSSPRVKKFRRILQDEEFSIPQADTASAAEPKGETSGTSTTTPLVEPFDSCMAGFGPQGDVNVGLALVQGASITSNAFATYSADPDALVVILASILMTTTLASAAVLAGQNVDGCGAGGAYGLDYWIERLEIAFECGPRGNPAACCLLYDCPTLEATEKENP